MIPSSVLCLCGRPQPAPNTTTETSNNKTTTETSMLECDLSYHNGNIFVWQWIWLILIRGSIILLDLSLLKKIHLSFPWLHHIYLCLIYILIVLYGIQKPLGNFPVILLISFCIVHICNMFMSLAIFSMVCLLLDCSRLSVGIFSNA